jgi:hypothetical protein
VVIGCSLPKKLQKRLADKLGMTSGDDNEWMFDGTLEEKFDMGVISTEDSTDGGYVFGDVLADVSSDGEYLERMTIPFDKLKKTEAKIHEILGEDVPIAIHLGTRPS